MKRKTKIGAVLITLSVALFSCTDKSDKFIGTWKILKDPNSNNTLIFSKNSDNQFVIVDNMAKNKNAAKSVATYNKESDKLIISGGTSPQPQEVNYDNASGHLIINGYELEKVK